MAAAGDFSGRDSQDGFADETAGAGLADSDFGAGASPLLFVSAAAAGGLAEEAEAGRRDLSGEIGSNPEMSSNVGAPSECADAAGIFSRTGGGVTG